MAIVFISPKDRQKVFILGIAGLFFLILIIIGLRVFLAKPKKIALEEVSYAFHAPEIRINFDVLKSDKVKNLEFFPEIEKEFNYKAQTVKGESKSGKIAAPSQEKATQILTALGLSGITLEEIKGGRSTPFRPYYEIKPPTPPKKTKK